MNELLQLSLHLLSTEKYILNIQLRKLIYNTMKRTTKFYMFLFFCASCQEEYFIQVANIFWLLQSSHWHFKILRKLVLEVHTSSYAMLPQSHHTVYQLQYAKKHLYLTNFAESTFSRVSGLNRTIFNPNDPMIDSVLITVTFLDIQSIFFSHQFYLQT